MLIEGMFTAITTPFYPDERVYYRKLEANVARYSRSLLAGMVVLGSTGEAPALDDAETKEVLRIAAQAASPEKILIAGVNRESVHSVLDLAEVAATALSNISETDNGSIFHSILPASIFARSNTSLIRFVSRSPSAITTLRFSEIW